MQMADLKKIHLCPVAGCQSAFDRPYRLGQHLLLHNNIRPFVCKEEGCDKAYSSKSHLDRHTNNVHKKQTLLAALDADVIYSCPTCMKTYSNRQNLKRHLSTHHLIDRHFTCDICRLEYKKKHQLTAHMFVHTGIKAFSCDECPMEFISLCEKNRHKRCHKSYKCFYCELSFKQGSSYQMHVRMAHTPVEFSCDVCGKKFQQRCHLVRHVKIHSRTISFPCPYENCQRSYSRNSNLRQHIMVTHQDIKHECTLCDARLSTKKKLLEHIEKRHNSEPKKLTPKTRATGRKIRKDAGVLRTNTALRLAGLPEINVEVLLEESYSSLFTEDENIASHFQENKDRVNTEKTTAPAPTEANTENLTKDKINPIAHTENGQEADKIFIPGDEFQVQIENDSKDIEVHPIASEKCTLEENVAQCNETITTGDKRYFSEFSESETLAPEISKNVAAENEQNEGKTEATLSYVEKEMLLQNEVNKLVP